MHRELAEKGEKCQAADDRWSFAKTKIRGEAALSGSECKHIEKVYRFTITVGASFLGRIIGERKSTKEVARYTKPQLVIDPTFV